MREGLSFEGLLLQAREVLRARWKLLAAVAAGWVAAMWAADRLKDALLQNADFYNGDRFGWLPGAVIAIPMIIGPAVMTGAVVRTGHERRPLSEALKHWALAAVTILLVIVVTRMGRPILLGLASLNGPMDGFSPLLAVASLIQWVIGLLLFAFLGMITPAALERPVSPWTAAAVALKLSQGRRGWLALIAIAWSVVMLAPMLIIAIAGLQLMGAAMGLTTVAQMLTAVGLGVLYLELRRLHGALQPGALAETFA